jgi:hypothetical protein
MLKMLGNPSISDTNSDQSRFAKGLPHVFLQASLRERLKSDSI